jgi:hypothetical protein
MQAGSMILSHTSAIGAAMSMFAMTTDTRQT